MHADELEAGQLYHGHIVGAHLGQHGQKRCADVAAQMYFAASGLEELGDQGRGGGLAVGAGHSHDGAGAEIKEQFHLAGDHGTGRHGILQGFLKVAHKAGGAHNDILALEAVQIVLTQAQVDAQLPDGGGVISEVLHALFLVAQGNVCPQLHKFFDQGLVADARADKGHLFALDELFELLLILLHKNRSSFVQYRILNTPELPGICEFRCTIIVHLAALGNGKPCTRHQKAR